MINGLSKSRPIGMARSGTWISLAAEDGAMGELVIHGASVGKGYIGASAEQNARFLTPKGYRTGDWGMQDADGNWYFHGRRDREIKLNGYRIDLNAVETTIRDCPGVADVIVTPPVDESRMSGLQAFVLGAQTPEALSAIAVDAATKLEPHVVPRFWYGQENCVFNAGAKLDRQAIQADMLCHGARYVYTARRKPHGDAAKHVVMRMSPAWGHRTYANKSTLIMRRPIKACKERQKEINI